MRVKPYLTVFRIRVLAVLQYRAAALAKLFPPIFVGLVQAMFFTAFFRGSSGEQPMTLTQTITYCWLVQILVGVQPWSGDPEVLTLIKNGNIAYELCRPVDLYTQWLSRLAAQRLMPLLLSSVPLAVVGRWLVPAPYRMGAPASAASGLAFLLTLAGVVLMSSALSNILGIITVWTVSGEGLYYLVPILCTLLSGAIVPLPLWPARLQWLINVLPFRALLDTPAQVYLGLIPPGRTLPLVATQLLWTGAFVLLGRLLLGKAIKAVVVQGG